MLFRSKLGETYGPGGSLTGTYNPFGSLSNFQASSTTPLTGDVVTFTPTWSGITPLYYGIDFGDGNYRIFTGATATHKYRKPGTYTIKVFAGSATSAILVATYSNFLTASEANLASLGTLLSWVNFQDESTVSLSGDLITSVLDKVGGGLSWSTPNGDPKLETKYDQYGVFKTAHQNYDYSSDITLGTPAVRNQAFKSSSDILSGIDTATAQRQIFFLNQMYYPIGNVDILGGDTITRYLRIVSRTSFTFRTSTLNTAQTLSGFTFRMGGFYLHEIQIDAGTLRYYIDGTLIHTQTSMAGLFTLNMFGGALSEPSYGRWIAWAVYSGILSGSNLTDVRNYFLNKKP